MPCAIKRGPILSLLIAAGMTAILFGGAAAQHGDELERIRRGFTAQMDQRLAEPFKGITTRGQIEPGLFAVRSTGVSTEPVRRAAAAFLAGLTPEQRSRTLFASADDVEWRKWANQDPYLRQGISFLEMTDAQRALAFDLLRAGLSAKGLRQTRDIMRLNHTVGELNDNFDRYGEWRYHITVMGEPSATEPWGWQFDGHHAIINYFILGDQVVMTPFFAGSEPVRARAGKYAGTVILQEEQDRGLALINALPEAQRSVAILNGGEKTATTSVAEAFRDNIVLDYQGVRASQLPAAQRQQLLDLIALHVSALDDGHARVKMREVQQHLDRTTFAWIGQRQPESVFYYRIHSPVILIEFDHQVPIALRRPGGPTGPQRDHIHVVVRTPNGNDYGKDLLRQHYAQHSHG